MKLGLLINEMDGLYQRELVRGFRLAAQMQGVNLLCFPGGQLKTEQMAVRQFNMLYELARRSRLDGIVSVSGSFCAGVPAAEMSRFNSSFAAPLVELGTHAEFPWVSCNNAMGMTELVDHFLVDHGFRRIAFISGPEMHSDVAERLAVFRERHALHGVPLDESLIFPGSLFGPDGAAAVRAMLARNEPLPDAIISVNDSMAYKAINALQEAGLRVPEDIAVAGFDDMASNIMEGPGLTSVRQDLPLQSETAMSHLIAHLGGAPLPQETLIPTRLIRRHSCGCGEVHGMEDLGGYCASGASITGKLARLRVALHEELAGAHQALRHCIRLILEESVRGELLVVDVSRCLEFLLNELESDQAKAGSAGQILFRTLIWLGEFERMRNGDAMVELVYPSWSPSDLLLRVPSTSEFTLGSVLQYVRDALMAMGIKNTYIVLFPRTGRVESWDCSDLPDEGQLVLAIRDGLPLSCAEFDRFPIKDLLPIPVFHEAGGAVYTVLPLFQQTEQYGYLILDTGHNFGVQYERLREAIASLVTSTIVVRELGQLRDMLSHDLSEARQSERVLAELAERDELTGLLNRRGFLDGAAHLREGTKESLLLISADLDGLKYINDTFGHAAGDEAIRAMADVLTETFRDGDLIARLGGDEYVVISVCPTHKLETTLCRRLAEKVDAYNKREKKPWRLASSIGAIRFPARDENDVTHWLALADELLYEDKRARKRGRAESA